MEGKVSGVLIFLVLVNVIAFLIASTYAASNPYIQSNSLLAKLYTSKTTASGDTIFTVDQDSAVFGGVPQTPPKSYIEQLVSGATAFIDRVLVLFDFIQVIIGVALAPFALFIMMGLPTPLVMLLGIPIATLYLLGLMDLLGGGNS